MNIVINRWTPRAVKEKINSELINRINEYRKIHPSAGWDELYANVPSVYKSGSSFFYNLRDHIKPVGLTKQELEQRKSELIKNTIAYVGNSRHQVTWQEIYENVPNHFCHMRYLYKVLRRWISFSVWQYWEIRDRRLRGGWCGFQHECMLKNKKGECARCKNAIKD